MLGTLGDGALEWIVGEVTVHRHVVAEAVRDALVVLVVVGGWKEGEFDKQLEVGPTKTLLTNLTVSQSGSRQHQNPAIQSQRVYRKRVGSKVHDKPGSRQKPKGRAVTISKVSYNKRIDLGYR